MFKQFLSFLLVFLSTVAIAQNVGIGTTTPNAKAILDIRSNNKGLLPPRITEDSMLAMGNVPNGMVIYNVSRNCVMVYNNPNWRCLSSGSSDKFQPVANNYFSGADSSTASEITDMQFGAGNHYYVTGTFSGAKLSLGNSIELTAPTSIPTAKHGFIAKYDSTGNCIWATKLLGVNNTTQILPASIAVNDAGSVFITGTFNDSIYLFNANGVFFNKLANDVSGDYDIFMIKLLPDGSIDWRRREGNNGGRDETKAIRLQGSSLFVCGQFHGAQTFGTTTQITLNSAGGLDGFYVSYDTATGTNCVSGRRVGGALGDEIISDIWTNGLETYITGSYENSITIPVTGVIPAATTSLGSSDMFIIGYTIFSGPNAAWVLFGGGTQFERGIRLTVQSGQLYVAGVFSSPTTGFLHISFPAQSIPPTINTHGSTDVLVLRIDASTGGYNQTGSISDSWIVTMGGTGLETIKSLDVSNNFCAVAGEFSNKLEFANGYPLYSSGGSDGFVALLTTLTGDLYKATTVSSLYNDKSNATSIRSNGDIVVAGACTQPVLLNGVSSNKPFILNQQAYLWLMK